MKYWEIDSDQYGHIRIEWNGYSNFNLQAPIIADVGVFAIRT